MWWGAVSLFFNRLSTVAKETYYFSHDYNAQQDHKMVELWGECGLKGVGFYWILIEHLHSDPDSRISKKQLEILLKMYGKFHGEEVEYREIQQVLNSTKLLVEDDDGFYYSGRVLRHKKDREKLSEVRSIAGKKSAEVRANSTSVQQKGTSVQQYKGKERKGKEHIQASVEKPKKEKIGTHVQLSKEELVSLSVLYGTETALRAAVDKMNDYCASKGKSYKDYAAALRNWYRIAVERGEVVPVVKNRPEGTLTERFLKLTQ